MQFCWSERKAEYRSPRSPEMGRMTKQAISFVASSQNSTPCRIDAPEALCPLTQWFRELEPAAARHGGILLKAAAAARHLLATSQEVVALHGDIHHGNILDFGARGWLAIDPKGLLGERGFDYGNIFCNPREMATAPGRLSRQASIVAEASGLDRTRLLQWILAYAGLSAAWFLNDGEDAELPLAVGEAAAAELANCGR